jgi:hypothetical protein
MTLASATAVGYRPAGGGPGRAGTTIGKRRWAARRPCVEGPGVPVRLSVNDAGQRYGRAGVCLGGWLAGGRGRAGTTIGR